MQARRERATEVGHGVFRLNQIEGISIRVGTRVVAMVLLVHAVAGLDES